MTGQMQEASPAHGSAAPRSSNKRVIALVAPRSSPKRCKTADEGADADGAPPSSPATASTVSSLSGAALRGSINYVRERSRHLNNDYPWVR